VAIIAAIAVFGGIGPLVISSVALRQKKLLARGWYKVPWHADDGWLAGRIQDMPTNQASGLNGYHVVYHVKVTKFALNQWFLKVIQQWGGGHGTTGVKTNGEFIVTASLDVTGGRIGGRVLGSKGTKELLQIWDTGGEKCWMGLVVVHVCKGKGRSLLMAVERQNSNQLVEGTTQ